jgi:ubiquinone/menaquinone biosynthesis C-methylase UbiE
MAIDFQLAGNAAENFDQFVRILMAPFVEPILRRANLEEGKSVLDIGCGTGFFTRAAREMVGATGTAIGLDPNGPMLEVARTLSADDDLTIEWCEAFVEDMPFDGVKFDAIISTQTIMFFPDLERGIKEICSVLAPDGSLSISFFAGPLEQSPYMCAYTRRLEEILPGSSDLTHHAFRLNGDEVATMFHFSGFDVIEAETIKLGVLLPPLDKFLPVHIAGLPFAEDFASLDQSVQENFYSAVTDDLAAFVQPDGNVFAPLALHVVSGGWH